jgi:hypothetical protein
VVNSSGEKTEGEAFGVDLKKERAKPVGERKYPVYEANLGEAGMKYIIPLRGTGLWGPIWGYIALNDDLNTIFGATFDHQGETPGLGAEMQYRSISGSLLKTKPFTIRTTNWFRSLWPKQAKAHLPNTVSTRFRVAPLPVKVCNKCCSTT